MEKFKRSLNNFDRRLTQRAKTLGHRAERYLIGIIFLWFGLLKLLGEHSATSIIAKSVYWWDAVLLVPFLGSWEMIMGATLLFRSTIRIAVALFFIRLPGTLLALIYHWDECFEGNVFIPTVQGQYLLKELTLVGAALVIASTLPPLLKYKDSSHDV